MCGITGMIYLDRGRKIDPGILKRMSDSIIHRGPDDSGFYISRNVGLGFRRLSIIDLNTGHQPLANSNKTIFIIFNGEIYNYLENRDMLRNKGYKFRTTTDTEVILCLYEEYGEECLKYLRGMFAFAIWDDNNQQLFCARDRFGIKPFFYYRDDEKLVFGSEIKSILQCENIDKTLSAEALDSYLAFGYITSDLSIYKNIKKLRPAHFLSLSFKNGISFGIKKFWEVHFDPDYSKSEKQWIEEIDATLSETVKIHMISDVPLGAFLSGGIDSGSVVAMMAKNSVIPVKTFSIGFKEQQFNELQYAREIAAKYGCEHHEQIVEPESVSLLPKLVGYYDEPFGDASAIPTYYVSKFAREYVTVALSGDGGDELFAGYEIYSYLRKIYRSGSSSPAFNALIWGNLNKLIPQRISGKGLTYFLSKNRDLLGAYLCFWTREEREKLVLDYRPDHKYNGSEDFKIGLLMRNDPADFIQNIQHLDIQTYMVDDILTKVDRASMMNSLEVRVPLLDHKFAELSFKIPASLKLKGKAGKYIFKSAMARYLPENIMKHKKQGFALPISVWFKDDLRKYVNDTLMAADPEFGRYLDKKYVRKVIKDNQNGMRDMSSKIWSLVFLEEWLKQNKM